MTGGLAPRTKTSHLAACSLHNWGAQGSGGEKTPLESCAQQSADLGPEAEEASGLGRGERSPLFRKTQGIKDGQGYLALPTAQDKLNELPSRKRPSGSSFPADISLRDYLLWWTNLCV